jgi:hypothetical protein
MLFEDKSYWKREKPLSSLIKGSSKGNAGLRIIEADYIMVVCMTVATIEVSSVFSFFCICLVNRAMQGN